jgi:transposase
VSYFGLNPRVRQSGLGAAHHGRISKIGRSHARAMLVEAAWAAAKAPGPLHAFFVRIRARRGHQIAAVAVARKLTVLCWHLLTKGEDYQWARPALVANKTRAMQLQAGHPQQKGSRRGPAYAYKDQGAARPRDDGCRPGGGKLRAFRGAMEAATPKRSARAPQFGRTQMRQPGDACADAPRFATRSPAPDNHNRR